MDPLTSFFTITDIYDPQKADQLKQQRTVNAFNNRLMAMELEEKGDSVSSRKAEENYFMNPGTVKADGTIEYRKPQNIGEYNAMMKLQQNETAKIKPMADFTQKLIEEGFKDNDPLKLQKGIAIVDSNPKLQQMFKQNGMWAVIHDTKVIDPTQGVYETLMPLDASMVKKISADPASRLSPAALPGYYNVKYLSPPGTDPLDPTKSKLLSVAPAKMTKDDLARRAANGDKQAEAELNAIVQGEAKDTGPPWVKGRIRQLMAGGMKHDEAEMQAAEEYEKRQDERAKQKVQFGVTIRESAKSRSEGGDAEAFKNWTPDLKKEWFDMYKVDKTALPPFGWRDVASRRAFGKEFAEYMKSGKLSGSDVVAGRAEMKADAASLQMQTKNKDMMVSFVNNIEKQTKRFEEIGREVGRYDTRILNMPLRKARMAIKGTPNENKLSMYITEISNESARLSSSNAQSIAQLTDASQKKWQDIHDENLSIRDMISLLRETNKAGRMRVQSTVEQLESTKQRMRGGQAKSTARDTSKAKSYLQGANSKADAIGRIRALAAKGWTKDELNEVVKGTKWE